MYDCIDIVYKCSFDDNSSYVPQFVKRAVLPLCGAAINSYRYLRDMDSHMGRVEPRVITIDHDERGGP